jgi:hypothetical protein
MLRGNINTSLLMCTTLNIKAMQDACLYAMLSFEKNVYINNVQIHHAATQISKNKTDTIQYFSSLSAFVSHPSSLTRQAIEDQAKQSKVVSI